MGLSLRRALTAAEVGELQGLEGVATAVFVELD
jgi:hypothetical protein